MPTDQGSGVDEATIGRSDLSGSRRILVRILYYLLTGVCVSGLAFVNQYPLVYSDSGAYMGNSFSLIPNDDRPIGYGLIIRAVSWQSTIWTVVLFQGAVASWLLMLMIREFIRDASRWLHVHLLLLAFLCICSSLPWYSAQLMADHYTPLVLLILFLLFKGKKLGHWREGGLWLLLFFFLATHNAHFPMMAVMLGMALLRVWQQRRNGASRYFGVRWAAATGVLCGSALMVMLFNYSTYGRMQLSRAGNVFLAGRLCEPGIMADYLRENCPTRPNPMCAYVGRLPEDAGDILWAPDQFVNELGLTIGQADSLLAPVVADVLCRPEYLARYLRSALVSSVSQLFQWEAGSGLGPYGEGSSPRLHLLRHLPDERRSYDHSRQIFGYWNDREATGRLQGMALILSLLVLALLWRSSEVEANPLLKSLALWVMAWVVLNAAVTSSLSVVDSRLQSRVMWLIPMTAFLVAMNIRSWTSYFKVRP